MHPPKPIKPAFPLFVLNVIYPLTERLLNLFFRCCLPLAVVSSGIAAYSLVESAWVWAALAGLAVVGFMVGWQAFAITPKKLRVTTLLVPGLPMRVAYFSDLHVNAHKDQRWTRIIVDAINRQRPELVLFGGDFYGHPRELALADLLAPLRDLQAPHGVFAIFGNHDRGLHDHDHKRRPAELEALLPQLGIRRLHNTHVDLPGGLRVMGVGELWTGEAHIDETFATAAAAEPAACTIFLGHNPDMMAEMTPAQHANLFLFGHTHHGQIYLPFLPGLGVPIRGKLWRGEFQLPQGRVYVGAGCGEASLPARFNTSPEIVILEPVVCGQPLDRQVRVGDRQ